MTRGQWRVCNDPGSMLAFLAVHLPDEETDDDPMHLPAIRKVRLFAAACCRRIDHLLIDKRSRTALDVLERYLDRRATKAQFDRAVKSAAKVTWDLEGVLGGVYFAACAACSALEDIQDDFEDAAEVAEAARNALVGALPDAQQKNSRKVDRAEQAVQAALIREIFGNPFRPVTLDRSWLTSDVVALARGIYEEKAFDRMPILADALQDAGCANEEVLNHCRDTKLVHIRGCWVVDLLLGKG